MQTEPAKGAGAPACCGARVFPWALFFILGLGVAGIDLWTKSWAFRALGVEIGEGPSGRPVMTPPEWNGNFRQLDNFHPDPIVIIPNYFEFEANLNYGAFSGWFSSHTGWLAVLSLVALAALIAFLYFGVLRNTERPSFWLITALGLIWGGTLGNLYDRSLIGAVRDFIKWFILWSDPSPEPWYWPGFLPWFFDGKPHVWPNFNIADSGICIGVAMIILYELRNVIRDLRARKRRKEPAVPAGAS